MGGGHRLRHGRMRERGSVSMWMLASVTPAACVAAVRRSERTNRLRYGVPSSDGAQPFVLDLARLRLRHRRGPRELIDPRERPARIDDHFRMRGDAALLVRGWDARIERRAPAVA